MFRRCSLTGRRMFRTFERNVVYPIGSFTCDLVDVWRKWRLRNVIRSSFRTAFLALFVLGVLALYPPLNVDLEPVPPFIVRNNNPSNHGHKRPGASGDQSVPNTSGLAISDAGFSNSTSSTTSSSLSGKVGGVTSVRPKSERHSKDEGPVNFISPTTQRPPSQEPGTGNTSTTVDTTPTTETTIVPPTTIPEVSTTLPTTTTISGETSISSSLE